VFDDLDAKMTGPKLGLVLLLAFPIGFRPGTPPVGDPAAAPPAEDAASPASDALVAPASDAFASTVRPVLIARCAPCHEPGGKMYDSLPFDKGQTITSHREGVLKRLKGDDRAAVEKWLATLPRAQAQAQAPTKAPSK
jgi:cytochrome c553